MNPTKKNRKQGGGIGVSPIVVAVVIFRCESLPPADRAANKKRRVGLEEKCCHLHPTSAYPQEENPLAPPAQKQGRPKKKTNTKKRKDREAASAGGGMNIVTAR
jgi:hypothetical protein